jgi:signal transduction histidine kinase
MNFSWKVFFSTIIMMLITFSIGGYFLISTLFQSAYDREVNSAREENKMLQYSIATALSAVTGDDSHDMKDMITGIAGSMLNNVRGSNTQIRISDQEYKSVYESKALDFDTKLLQEIDTDIRGYLVTQEGSGIYIVTASMLQVSDKSFYLESFRDISSIYKERDEQYQIFMRLLLALIVGNGIISYLLSLWLTYPIKRVSRVAHKISRGDLNYRVKIKSRDEIGKLAQDFNHMTDSLENKINELEDITHRQEDFIGSFAHELKTPLTSIIGYADILRSKKLTPEMTMISADYIFKEGNRLEALSLKLLELIVMKKMDLDIKRVNARQLLEEVSGLIDPVLVKEQISYEMTAEDAVIYVEPDLIKTVLINLIDNAKKAMEGEALESAGKITVRGRREAGGYGIYIKDNGKGIPREELSRITDAFYMVDKSRAREQGGAGLGLAICSEIVNRHRGKLEFNSVLGKGTTVRLFFKEGAV